MHTDTLTTKWINSGGAGSRLLPEQMTTRSLNGGTNMPAFGSILKPDEVNDLIAFLRSRTERGKGSK